MSTIRFSELVKRYGKPGIKSLWTKPEEDASFIRSVKQGRVLTLFQEPSSKHKDSGEIGFHQKTHAAYVVFPKPLDESKGVKVVGIKYDLITEPPIQDPLPAKAWKKVRLVKQNSKSKKPEAFATFDVRVRRTATLEMTVAVQAKTPEEAGRRAIQIAEAQSFDSSKATIKTETLHSPNH